MYAEAVLDLGCRGRLELCSSSVGSRRDGVWWAVL